MRIAVINGGVFGSTGSIISGIKRTSGEENCDIDFFIASPVTSTNKNKNPDFEYYKIGNSISRKISVMLSIITGMNGCYAIISTYIYLKALKHYSPDVIHLHTLHDSFINLPMLFKFLKKKNIPVIWTLHDCWAFTGKCPHYSLVQCDKWQANCYNCPQYKEYPRALFDKTSKMHQKKKKWFGNMDNLILVTPSEWLKEQVSQSFLKDYPIKVINNGINLSEFKPITDNDIRERYHIPNYKTIILGVSYGWDNKKGINIFIALAGKLNFEQYQIILVGTDAETERLLPKNIIAIRRTENKKELASIYSASDIFLNPTREDNYPTVNMESLACGTPVITFNTGGCAEIIDEKCGRIIKSNSIDEIETAILTVTEEKKRYTEFCLDRAKQFDEKNKYSEYINLYRCVYDRTSKS